uniref:Large ribosomal subunit protein bL20 n=1 Tax=candidate division WOR-3 bacterium TaxID=2052148 RepID=A0A7C4U811_UNCW3
MRATPGSYTRRRRKKWLKLAKGYFGKRKNCYRIAREAVMKALVYAYRDRRQKKRDFRRLWITRIGIACKDNGISYSKFINGIEKANIKLDRKILSDLAVREPEVFKKIVEIAKTA